MPSLKELKLAQKSLSQQQQVISELDAVIKDIDRAEKTITDLQTELAAATARYPSPRTTRQDVDYLTELLRCANKKLAWEKQIASLQKRTPALLDRLFALIDDPVNPPNDKARAEMLRVLDGVRDAMERLQSVKL